MAPPPEARNRADGPVYGHLVQARDIHGGVTVHTAPAAGPVPDVSLDPPRPATATRGRDDLLTTLRRAMRDGEPVPHVLTGPGGFGKTTIAAALAEHARAEGWTVFWVRPDTILPSMLEVAVELGGAREEADSFRAAPRQAARWVWRHLDSAPRPWLLVIDNADRPELLDPENRPGEQRGWLRSSPGGFVLVTSRVDDPALWAPATVHHVDSLGDADAATALTDHAGGQRSPGAERLAARLGGVPLALALAGRILATHGVLFPDADALLGHLDQDLTRLDALSAPAAAGEDDERRLLSGVWELSLRVVGERNPQAIPLLRVLAVLGADSNAVPLRRLPLSELAEGPMASLDEAGLARAINALVVHGLVTTSRQVTGTVSLRLHPLVSETLRAHLGPDSEPLLETARRLLEWRADHDLALEMGAYSALHVVLLRLHGHAHPDTVRAHIRFHRAVMLLGFEERAELGLRDIVDRSRADLGDEHVETLRARHALADALRARDRIEEAEDIYLAVFDARERVLGPLHPDTLSTRHQVTLMAALRGDLDTAEEGFRALWRTYADHSQEDDQVALSTLENLSFVLLYRGDHDGAEEGFRRVARFRATALGEMHPTTIDAHFGLARVAFERGDHRAAAEAFGRVVEWREEALGGDHALTDQAREWRERAIRSLGSG
ncbi:tetratricopeptide repeat protein [Nocardiopsis sp. NPDC007018]|uniref:tetratricopeptide repeat protein n=1 Tax=Nocardiopsis sp. NPDC007018 TaxID=3155721 RepID=UPI0033FC559C